MEENGLERIVQPPYSLNLASFDFCVSVHVSTLSETTIIRDGKCPCLSHWCSLKGSVYRECKKFGKLNAFHAVDVELFIVP
jgi:hypothetical protein